MRDPIHLILARRRLWNRCIPAMAAARALR